jgi:hypothetical protein
VALVAMVNKPGKRLSVVLIGASLLGFTAMDMAIGGRRALIPRYGLPTWLGLHMLVVGFLGSELIGQSWRRRWVAGFCLVFLVGCGIASLAIYLPRPFWWTSRPPALAEAAVLAQRLGIDGVVARPALDGVGLLSLAESLPRDTKILFLDARGKITGPLPPSVLLYAPPDDFLHDLPAPAQHVPGSAVWVVR